MAAELAAGWAGYLFTRFLFSPTHSILIVLLSLQQPLSHPILSSAIDHQGHHAAAAPPSCNPGFLISLPPVTTTPWKQISQQAPLLFRVREFSRKAGLKSPQAWEQPRCAWWLVDWFHSAFSSTCQKDLVVFICSQLFPFPLPPTRSPPPFLPVSLVSTVWMNDWMNAEPFKGRTKREKEGDSPKGPGRHTEMAVTDSLLGPPLFLWDLGGILPSCLQKLPCKAKEPRDSAKERHKTVVSQKGRAPLLPALPHLFL